MNNNVVIDKDILLVILGGLIGFLSSLGILIVEWLINRKGKIKIYYKFISSSLTHKPWGIYEGGTNRIIFDIPVVFEFQNTSKTTRVIRDVSLELYLRNEFVAKLVQGEYGTKSKKENGVETDLEKYNFGTDNGSYSFVLNECSIQKQNCFYVFSIYKNEVDKYKFDRIKICYYDERDKKKSYVLKKHIDGWSVGGKQPDTDWQIVKQQI